MFLLQLGRLLWQLAWKMKDFKMFAHKNEDIYFTVLAWETTSVLLMGQSHYCQRYFSFSLSLLAVLTCIL